MYKKQLIFLALAFILCAAPFRPHAQSRLSKEEWLALIHLDGLNFVNPEGRNERVYQKVKIENDLRNHRIVVLGSSRVFHLDSRMLNDPSAINDAMSGGTIEDDLAICLLLERTQKKPNKIIIGLDPWLFNAMAKQDRWMSLQREAEEMDSVVRQKKKLKPLAIKKTQQDIYRIDDLLFSAADFDSVSFANLNLSNLGDTVMKASINSMHLIANRLVRYSSFYDSLIKKDTSPLTNAVNNLVDETRSYRSIKFDKLRSYQKNNIGKLNRLLLMMLCGFPETGVIESFPTAESANKVGIFYSDGGVFFGDDFRERDSSVVFKEAPKNITYSTTNYSEFDARKKELFDLLIKHLTGKKIELVFFLSPYHPLVYKVYQTDSSYAKVLEFEKYVREVARINHIRVIGSYDPAPYNLNSTDFYDGMHLKIKGMKAVMRKDGMR